MKLDVVQDRVASPEEREVVGSESHLADAGQ